jgi:predicted HicB family RNase H-like nuclease
MKKKDHYLKVVEWSEEDQCYVGSIPGWIGKCCHGDNEEDVYRQLCQVLDEWIEIYENDNIPLPTSISGKKYSGKFQLRVDSELHKALAIKAMQSNESLNSFCGKILRKTILKANNSMNSDR